MDGTLLPKVNEYGEKRSVEKWSEEEWIAINKTWVNVNYTKPIRVLLMTSHMFGDDYIGIKQCKLPNQMPIECEYIFDDGLLYFILFRKSYSNTE